MTIPGKPMETRTWACVVSVAPEMAPNHRSFLRYIRVLGLASSGLRRGGQLLVHGYDEISSREVADEGDDYQTM